ncbi:hypothetical protein BKA67DRAFT_545804 [Truncatella angustata]|uniref:Uncharacterized protein n=1 Tax=Truncatella angustata TaxID=152316 RepID=A0A9P8UV68_9PEZI|nr:uncharacterized protein BKA67DRAFT_545804 [Truncatella angustata]KAH6659799.1 hypothetical protein BKA67DRAFT_545804 [Truncatella angustata]
MTTAPLFLGSTGDFQAALFRPATVFSFSLFIDNALSFAMLYRRVSFCMSMTGYRIIITLLVVGKLL